VTIEQEMVETEFVQHNVKQRKLQSVEIEHLKNEKNVIVDLKIEKIKNVQKNALHINQIILIVEIE
jgi:ribose 5-phosphate isomerase